MTRAETIADLLREVATEHPDREAYVHDGKQATYALARPFGRRLRRRRCSTSGSPRATSSRCCCRRRSSSRSATSVPCASARSRRRSTSASAASSRRASSHRTEPAGHRRRRRRRGARRRRSGDRAPRRRSWDPRSAPGAPAPERLPRLDADRPDVHRVDERHHRRSPRARCTTTPPRPRSRGTWASSPRRATVGSACCRSPTWAT